METINTKEREIIMDGGGWSALDDYRVLIESRIKDCIGPLESCIEDTHRLTKHYMPSVMSIRRIENELNVVLNRLKNVTSQT